MNFFPFLARDKMQMNSISMISTKAPFVIEHIEKKLRQCLPDIDTDIQVIRLSTTKALMARKYGIMNAEFASLTEAIGCLVAKSIQARLERNWR